MNDYKGLIGELKEQCSAMDYDCCELAFRAADAIEQLVKERDAFMDDFMRGFKNQIEEDHGIYRCDICKHAERYGYCKLAKCNGFSHFEWRGVKEDIHDG